VKAWIIGFSALFAVSAAALWFYSAKVEVWADDQQGPRSDNMIILKDGRQFDVTGTAQAQSRWSAYAAVAAGLSALLQAIALLE
jgi:hypothetical protein